MLNLTKENTNILFIIKDLSHSKFEFQDSAFFFPVNRSKK